MLKIENLTKTYNYKKSNAFIALKDVSLEVEDGEMLAIIGKSGAGKSTLLHIIGCIDKFEKGSYIIDGTDVHSLSDNKLAKIRNEKVGIVMQDFALIDEYSVIENVMIPLNFSKKKLGKPKELAMKALQRVGIANLAKKPVSKLSGGQKQRVAIARAIVNDPSFILADEPTGALDTKTSSEIMELFTELNKSGKTVIIITHDLTVADKCKRKVEISDGRII
ncbi:ABC transporter ATP-binding protein [Pseudoruminococcus massiliensis]|uniref:ABC transporter ATP-binding protein n=1 Tax=Pseudoruminococcus massiliensis TaxID=2086583 RepID=UPI000D0E68B7|nr:ABC transporter ATP-binding protein [Pseudoruminococcus massiliensis]